MNNIRETTDALVLMVYLLFGIINYGFSVMVYISGAITSR